MMGNLYAQLLVIEYRQVTSLGIRGFSLALNILLNLALLPRIGVQGAAVSALVSELCALTLLFLARLRPVASWRIEPAHS
jgi:Na+-driven multidrug efflux pump